jgi:tetratricopeptide (TPR) repeat protein
MEHRLLTWRRIFATSLLLTAAGSVAVAAQGAQQPSSPNKFKVLVLPLTRVGDAKGNFGKDVADELRKLIETTPRHDPVEKTEIDASLKKYGLKPDEMDCVKNRQLATQINSELAVCGRFATSGTSFQIDSIQVISAKTQEAFEIPNITAGTAKEAAAKIFDQFKRIIGSMETLTYCFQYIESQQYDQAIKNCDDALAINPNSERGNKLKAFALFSQAGQGDNADKAKLQQALDLYKKVLATNPIEQEALRTGGIIAARLGQQELSRQYFKQYLELNPGDVSVRVSIANDQAKADDPEGALRVIEEGLKTDSANVDLLTFAGIYAGSAAFKAQRAASTPGSPAGKPGEVPASAKKLYETSYGYLKKAYDAKKGDVDAAIAEQMIKTLVILERNQEAARRKSQGERRDPGYVRCRIAERRQDPGSDGGLRWRYREERHDHEGSAAPESRCADPCRDAPRGEAGISCRGECRTDLDRLGLEHDLAVLGRRSVPEEAVGQVRNVPRCGG